MTSTSPHEHLLTEHRGQVLWIYFNRPEKLNCFRDDMLDAVVEILDSIEEDDSVSVIVFRGKGRCFSTGYDISPDVELPEYAEPSRRFFKRRYHFLQRVWEIPKPFIAAVHGYCLAAASDLMNTCDLAVAADDTEIGYPAVRWGGHTHRLSYPWTLPQKKAKELMFTGDRITAGEAEHHGMVNRVVPLSELDDTVQQLAERIAMIPISGLVVNKTSMNYAYEAMGYRLAMQYSFQIAETNMWRENPFFKKAESEGLSAALEWRDGRFDDS